ncbi:hypothetical protein Q7P37_010176 [Cladosporium fusiforme]
MVLRGMPATASQAGLATNNACPFRSGAHVAAAVGHFSLVPPSPRLVVLAMRPYPRPSSTLHAPATQAECDLLATLHAEGDPSATSRLVCAPTPSTTAQRHPTLIPSPLHPSRITTDRILTTYAFARPRAISIHPYQMPSPANDVSPGLVPQTQPVAPITPQPSHASIPQETTHAVAKEQADRVEHATASLTPPPSTQVPNNGRAKSRTPASSGSHISTPPPTVDTSSQESTSRSGGAFARTMTDDQIATASPEELRTKVAEFQAAYQEAKMSAAHHRLQYQMLAQESAAAIERMAVEARMVQCENEVIHVAEQAKASVAPLKSSPIMDDTVPVQKDLYRRMCIEIQRLSDANHFLEAEHRQQEKVMFRQDTEIAGLSDKVLMMRDRIRKHREGQDRARSASIGRHFDSTPRSIYSTPRRPHGESHNQPQSFAALLQASEMASSQEAGAGKPRKGHSRNISLPVTPKRSRKQPPLFQTPQGNHQPLTIPSTAPAPRTSNLRTPDVYTQHALPVKRNAQGPPSEGTVSASDRDDDDNNDDDDDSEAETDILEPNEISESQASLSASRMLRAEQHRAQTFAQHAAAQNAHRGGGASNLRQGKLFGAVRKANVVRAGEDEPPAKRARVGEVIGLGIQGVPH